MILTLNRIAKKDLYIFGTLWHDHKLICRILENDNHEIPAGQYTCIPGYYHKGKYKTWEIIVPGRTDLKFHRGNWPSDSKGCPLTGSSFGYLMHKATNSMRMAMLGSGIAFDKLMEYTAGQQYLTLKITEEYDI